MPATSYLLPAHLAATVAMAGVLWVVQLAVYPLFNAVGAAGFTEYHRRYTNRIGLIVLPLMLIEAVTAAALLWSGFGAGLFRASLALLAVNWLSTAIVQVPLHRRLSRGYEAPAHRRLVRSNWIRTLAWTARAGLVLSLIP
jgi:uncharacterized membrane protein